MKIFSGNSNKPLAEAICKHLNLPLGEIYTHSFPSGESYVRLMENVRGKDVFLIQSNEPPSNEKLMELLVMIDATKRASANRITVVVPGYFFYSRQDRKDKSRAPISAKLIANLLTVAGANRVLGMDFHSQQLGGFFDIPTDQLYAMPVFSEYLQRIGMKDVIVVSPDEGAVKRCSAFASHLKCNLAIHLKKRIGDTTVESQGLVGDVKDKNVIVYDDLAESCGTLLEVARVCKTSGALSVRGLITHNCLTDAGRIRLETDTYLDKLVMTNTNFNSISHHKIEIVDVSQVFAEAIRRIHNSESISGLFGVTGF
jgi:ribose-phosphate pyrophosphokinase